MESLKELLLQKEKLYKNINLSDDEYYRLTEMIDNIIINQFSIEEIERTQQELNLY